MQLPHMGAAGVVIVIPVENQRLRDVVDILAERDFYEKREILAGEKLLLVSDAVLFQHALAEHRGGVADRASVEALPQD